MGKSTNAQKGRIVEDIIQKMHSSEDGLLVQSRVKLRSKDNPRRRREVDVLVTGHLAAQPIHLAFECKNYGRRIGVAKIGEFKDKLEDVGIPVQHGFMIGSIEGFTRDAIARANSVGIKLLVLEGLTEDRLMAEVHAAFQSSIYLLASVTSITLRNNQNAMEPSELMFLRNSDGNVAGGLLDLEAVMDFGRSR